MSTPQFPEGSSELSSHTSEGKRPLTAQYSQNQPASAQGTGMSSPDSNEPNPKVSWFKKWQVWAAAAAVLFVIIIAQSVGGSDADTADHSTEPTAVTTTIDPEAEASASAAAAAEAEASASAAAASQLSISQQNAQEQARSYLELTGFSRSGLIDQLEYEGYTTEDATYAVDSLNVDWNAQAAQKAQEYLELTSFSRDGLIDQLEYEGFTPEQAEAGVTAVGY